MTELATPPTEQEQDVKRISHWIGGRIVAGESGRSGPVYNPALGRQTGAVDFATEQEVDRAVQSAKEAYPAWRATSLSRKSAILFRIRELLVQRMDNSHSRAVLAIQIVDFFRDVVRSVLQPPHFLLERFALASYARERILLRSELRFSLILRPKDVW